MVKYLANEQWGNIVTGTVSIVVIIFMNNANVYYQMAIPFLTMVAITMISGMAREYLIQKGGALIASSRLDTVLGYDRELTGRGKQKPADPKSVQRWKDMHTVVYVGKADPKVERGRLKYTNSLRMMQARLAEVTDWLKDNDYRFFSYSKNIDLKEQQIWGDGTRRSPATGAIYLQPSSGSIIIIGSTPEEVWGIKPHDDLMEDWKSIYAFGQWQVEHDHNKKVIIHNEVTPIDEKEENAPLADAYDPAVKGRGAFKQGVNFAPSLTEDRRERVAYVK